MKRLLVTILLAGLFGSPTVGQEPKPTAEQIQFFETKIRPLLHDRCSKCHGPQKQQNGLRLDSAAALRAGGDSGPAVVPGKPEESLLIRAVNHDELKMPPKEKLPSEEIAALTEWVRRGAPWPQAQGLQPVGIDIEKARRTHWAF